MRSDTKKWFPLALLLLICFYFWNKTKQAATSYAYTSPGTGSNAFTYTSAISSLTTLVGAVSQLFKGNGVSNSTSSTGSQNPAGSGVAYGNSGDYLDYEDLDI